MHLKCIILLKKIIALFTAETKTKFKISSSCEIEYKV